jgi:hypothetical protein
MRRSVYSSIFCFLAGALALGAAPVWAATCHDMDATTRHVVRITTRHVVEAVTRHVVGSAMADTVSDDSTRHSNVHMRIGVGDHDLVNVEVEDQDDVKQADYVRFGENIDIAPGEHLSGDVVAIGGNVTVAGKVDGDCVSIGGNVHLKEGAEVEGDLVCMGGTLTLDDSVKVGSDAVSLWGRLKMAPSAKVYGHVSEVGVGRAVPPIGLWNHHEGAGSRVLGFFGRIVWVLLLIGMGLLAFSLFPTRMRRLADTVHQRGLVTFLAGMAGWILWLPAVVLLCITLVGIPVAILFIVFTPIMALLGYLAVAEIVGKRLVDRLNFSPVTATKIMFVGVVALESAVLLGKFLGLIGSFLHYFGMLLAVLGWSVIFVAVTMGFGAFLITRFRAAQTPPIEAPALVPPAPPASPQSYSVSGG